MKRRVVLMVFALSCACVLGLMSIACFGPKAPALDATIAKTFTTGSYDGTTLLVVELDVTNNTDTIMPASVIQMYATATLDGKTLSEGYLSSDNPNALPMTSSISSKSSGLAQLVYILPSTEGAVDLVINVDSTDYSSTIEVLNESIDLANVEAIVSETDYEVKINDVTLTDDGEGKDLIVLSISFTNNSDSGTSFSSAINTELFQNDIALKSGHLPYNHPSHNSDLSSNSYTDIKKGASIELQVVYELNDAKNPVEIKCIDSSSYDKAVILEKKIEVGGTPSSGTAAGA